MAITLQNIDGGSAFDWGKASDDYAKYRDIYPQEFYQRIANAGFCVSGHRVLDLGTGTGILPRNLRKFGAEFVGADISAEQIEQARKLSEGMDIEYVVSAAENLDFPDISFDVITAAQCFIYFDTAVIMPKLSRLLKPNGHALIFWLGTLGNISRDSWRSVKKHNPDWNGDSAVQKPRIPTIPDNIDGLFNIERADSYDISLPFTRESWHGRVKASRGILASSLTPEQITAWEQEHLAYMSTLPEQFDVLHYVTTVVLRKI